MLSPPICLDDAVHDAYLQRCREVIATATSTDGSKEFHLAADAIEPGRINVQKRCEAVAAFRAPEEARVVQHDVSSS